MYVRTRAPGLLLVVLIAAAARAGLPVFDYDGDGDIDFADYVEFVSCQTSPVEAFDVTAAGGGGVETGDIGGTSVDDPGDAASARSHEAHTVGPCRLAFDWDDNGAIDMRDFARFARFFDGGNPADCNGDGLPDDLELALHYASDCNGNGVPDDCDIAAGTAADCDADGVPDDCVEFGLTVEDVLPVSENGADGYRVTTTGGIFDVLPSHIDVRRRIDPATQAVDPNAPVVARLSFDASLGEITVHCQTAQSCELRAAGGLRIRIGADSLVMLTASIRDTISYTYESLLSDPTWVARKAPSEPAAPGDEGNRMWARLGEGTIHLVPPDSEAQVIGGSLSDPIHVTLPPEAQSALAVFPSRPIDLDRLYGADARPHVIISLTDWPSWGQIITDPDTLDELAGEGFGTIVLFNGFYDDRPWGYWPHASVDDPRLHYAFAHPERTARFIRAAHRHGFKVLAYMLPGAFSTDDQDIADTLRWMGEFQARHDLDGWYLDGGEPYPGGDWPANYAFIRAVRRQVGDEGIIYHHSTVDIWGGRGSDVVFTPLEAWEDFTLRGEVGANAEVRGPDDPFLADICAAHSGVLAAQKVRSHGAAMTIAESTRLFQQNLWGYYADNAWVVANQPFWADHGLQHWRTRQAEYLAGGDFSMAYDWPPAWYHALDPDTDVSASTTVNTITVEFATPHAITYGEIRVVYDDPNRYSFDHAWGSEQIFIIERDCTPSSQHTITAELPENDRGLDYRVLVRGYEGSPAACGNGGDQTMAGDNGVWGTVIVVPATLDCNHNGIDDAIDIAEGASCDIDENGVPDECEIYECAEGAAPDPDCPDADVNCDGEVSVFDVIVVINSANWGKYTCSDDPPLDPRADVNRDGVVNYFDRAAVEQSPCYNQSP